MYKNLYIANLFCQSLGPSSYWGSNTVPNCTCTGSIQINMKLDQNSEGEGGSNKNNSSNLNLLKGALCQMSTFISTNVLKVQNWKETWNYTSFFMCLKCHACQWWKTTTKESNWNIDGTLFVNKWHVQASSKVTVENQSCNIWYKCYLNTVFLTQTFNWPLPDCSVHNDSCHNYHGNTSPAL